MSRFEGLTPDEIYVVSMIAWNALHHWTADYHCYWNEEVIDRLYKEDKKEAEKRG